MLEETKIQIKPSNFETIDFAVYDFLNEKMNLFCTTNNGWQKILTAYGFDCGMLAKDGFEICQDGNDFINHCFTVRLNDKYIKVKYKDQLISTCQEFKKQTPLK